MRRKSYGFKVAGQTMQGSARLAILGKEYVTTKRRVNLDVDRAKAQVAEAQMLAALAVSDVKVTRSDDYKAGTRQTMKATAMPMNFYKGTGYGF